MNNQIETFIDFLLDTETTSEISFSQAILKNHELYHQRYQSNFDKVVNQKFQQWKDFYHKEQSAIDNRIAINAGNVILDNKSESESEQESSDDDEEGKTQQQSTVHKQDQVNLYSIL
jgi:hypothetical protein